MTASPPVYQPQLKPPPVPPPLVALQRCADGLIPATQTCPDETKDCGEAIVRADQKCPSQSTAGESPCKRGRSLNPATGRCESAPRPACPQGSNFNRESGQCDAICQDGSTYRSATRQCEQTCPNGVIYDAKARRCEPQCPSGTTYNQSTRHCETPCSGATTYNPRTRRCETPCPSGTTYNPRTRECEAPCQAGTGLSPATGRCETVLPLCDVGRVDPATGKCEPPCPQGSTFDGTTRQCTKTCPDGSVVLAPATCPPTPATVPELSGKSEADAIDSLRKAGLGFASRCCAKSNIPRGNVVSTDPRGGSRVPPHSQVIYMLSAGPWPALLILIAAITSAVAAAAAATWLFMPKRPRINVCLVGTPKASVAWGDPIEPQVDVEMPPVTSKVEFPPDKDRSDG